MKGKRQRKRHEEIQGQSHAPRQEPPPLKIKFDICSDKIACFIGEKKSIKRRVVRGSASLKKAKQHHPSLPSKVEKVKDPQEISAEIKQTDSEEIVQGSLNTILSEIQSKGISCAWSEGDDDAGQNVQNQASEMWSAFSVADSLEKSPASTMDLCPNVSFYMEQPYNYYPTQDNFGLRSTEQGSVFLLREDEIMYDARTTVMIRNIPNKYTIKELSEEIDYHFSNTYDFLYLPCDIRNQCNVGYGFINFISSVYLSEFYQIFQGRKWSKFKSEKICNLTYARLQGLDSLIDHFENSKVLNQKDKKYRPIIREFKKTDIDNLIKTQQLS